MIRERLGLSPDEIAPKVGAKTGAEILAYENDEEDPLVSVLFGYAKMAGIPVENLLYDDRDLWFGTDADKLHELIDPGFRAWDNEVPLIGTVGAGQPIETILTHDTISVPKNLQGGRTFALRVRGEAMIDENIQDGDIIIVASQRTAENGQVVVALIDGNYAVVTKFYREPDFIRLEPANPQFKPIFIKTPERVQILGIVTGLIRKYDA